MFPSFLAAPFSILTAVLSDTNITDIVHIFNESNVTSSANFAFEPTTLFFVNYPQIEDTENYLTPSLVLGESNDSTISDITSWGNSTAAGTDDDGNSSLPWCDDEDDEDDTLTEDNDPALSLNASKALQVSINMTLTLPMIENPPIFALNGTYNANETFIIGVFNLGSTSAAAPTHVHFFGGNFTAIGTSRDMISVLTNSTPALLEYWPPQQATITDAQRFIYLVFEQSENFDISLASNFTTTQTRNFSISDFIDQTSLGVPIGGTMAWLESCHCGNGNGNGTYGTNDTLSIPSGSGNGISEGSFFTPTGSLSAILGTETGNDGSASPTNSDTGGLSATPTSFVFGFGTDSSSMPSGTDNGISSTLTGSTLPSDTGASDTCVTSSGSAPGTESNVSTVPMGDGPCTGSVANVRPSGTSSSRPSDNADEPSSGDDSDDDDLPWCDELDDDGANSTTSTSFNSTDSSVFSPSSSLDPTMTDMVRRWRRPQRYMRRQFLNFDRL